MEGSPASAGTVGSGFTVTASDLAFILRQIKIAERHASSIAGTEPTQGPNPHGLPNDPVTGLPDPLYDPEYCSSLVGPNPNQIPDPLTSYGLRLVDGGCNNLVQQIAGVNGDPATPEVIRPNFARADQPFPRLTDPLFRVAEAHAPGVFGGGDGGAPGLTSYANVGDIYDSQPRVISNLIVDQTSANPAAVIASDHPVRSQDPTPSNALCIVDPHTGLDALPLKPVNCTPQHKTLFIPNVTTDVGLSPPYNALFTFFGQFFDHGVDQTVHPGGQTQVFIPLRADDPLMTLGPDGNAATLEDNLNQPQFATKRFMALPRAQNQPGPDGVFNTADDIHNANNTDTPWVDQSQTYTSHPAHQVFLREYTLDANGKPQSTGKFLDGGVPGQLADGTNSIGTWARTKAEAASKLGLQLVDTDIADVPMVIADVYGNFIRGPHGFPMWANKRGLVIEGDPAANGGLGVPAPFDVLHFDTPFLTDVNGTADPAGKVKDSDNVIGITSQTERTSGQVYDDELLDAHYVCGDGRCNENIALTTVHQIFHSEHNRLVGDETGTIDADPTLSTDYRATNCPVGCATNDSSKPVTFTFGERMFQAARFVTEMEYQHLVFEEFARKIQPAVRPFHVYNADINAAIPAEYAHAVYRFGHSMLNDGVARKDSNGVDDTVPLLTAFLNPTLFFKSNALAVKYTTAEAAAGSLIMGVSDDAGNELDEFVADTLRNNLVGQPLDLPTLNISRGRDTGIPPLNVLRAQIFAATGDGQMAPYISWSDYGQHLKHPSSLINFVAAYGQHPTVRDSGLNGILGDGDDVTTIEAKRAAARAIVDPQPLVLPSCGPDGVCNSQPTTTHFSTFCTASDVPVGCNEGLDDVIGHPADVQPLDASDFMFSTGDWANQETGLNLVDSWVGGLAEVTDLFGGLLGQTMNYVFQHTLENLQDGDRLYYLARTPGMNLRTQLEGNSFSELIMRNTTGTNTLKADAFATADCKFQLANLNGTAAYFAAHGAFVADDPTTECREDLLLQRLNTGTIQYKQFNNVDPPGINGQSVYNGTDVSDPNTHGVDRIFGGNDNDTFWGGTGNDVIDGGSGDDVILGGPDNDIETDQGGADVVKGGPGNDALDGGVGDDIMMGGDGQDVINGGANDNEEFAGPDTDFVIAGQGADAVFGDGGDDWIQGGSGQDLLQGDHGAPFFDDPAQKAPGNDIFVGQVGENDYDAEGGDDLMAQNPAIDRNAGAGGFDWAFHQYDTIGANDDMMINQMLVGLPIQLVVNRDRWQETEADSGSRFNDIIHGDALERFVGPGGFSGCDALGDDGVARITNLGRLVKEFPTHLTDVVTASINGYCPIVGHPNPATPTTPAFLGVWEEGNILLGGLGSDLIEGRENQDVLDGDHALTVAIGVKGPDGTEIGRTDLLEHGPTMVGGVTGGKFSTLIPDPTAGMTLQQAVFAGLVDPGNLFLIREIDMTDTGANTATPNVTTRPSDCTLPVDHGAPVTTNLQGQFTVTKFGGTYVDLAGTQNCDTALYSKPFLDATGAPNYVITENADGSVTVADAETLADIAAGGVAPFFKGDGIDTLWNFENLRFCTANDAVTKNCTTWQDLRLAPVVDATPASLAFGSVQVGTTSPTLDLSVRNLGFGTLHLNGVPALTLASNAAFSIVSGGTCTATQTLTHLQSCTVRVQFKPTAAGDVSGAVAVKSDATNTPTGELDVPVTGTGTAAVGSLNAAAVTGLTFVANLNVASAAQTVTLTNTGNAPLRVTGILFSTGFGRAPGAAAGTCSTAAAATPVAPGGNCTIGVRFLAGGTPGTTTGTLTINSNATNSPHVVSLTGNAVEQRPIAAVTPAPPGPLAFPSTRVLTNSTLDVTLANIGTGTIPMNVAVAVTNTTGAAFSRLAVPAGSNPPNCGTTLAAGASCTIRIRFAPTTGGSFNGNLRITTNSNNVAGSQQNITLTGTSFIVANNDTNPTPPATLNASANGGAVVTSFNVRANDLPANAGTVTILSQSFTNGGAGANATVNAATQQIQWTTTVTAGTNAGRQAQRRGTYTVTYQLTNGTATAIATYTLKFT